MRDGWPRDQHIDTAPIDHSQEVVGIKRHRVKVALVGVGSLLVGLVVVWLLQRQHRLQHPPEPEPKPPPVQQLAQTQESLRRHEAELPSSYAGQDRRPKEPEVIVKEVQAAELPPETPPTRPPVPQRQTSPTLPPQRVAPATTQTTEKKGWYVREKRPQVVGKPPIERPKRPTDAETRQAGTLIPPVVWEVPADRDRVIYRDQIIHGQLMHDVNSDVPGDIKIKVTKPVTSRFNEHIILWDAETRLIGVQDGKPEFGDRRLPLKIVQGLLPDGRVMAFDQAAVADKHGANGLKGKVNNHFPQLILATGLTALLNIGSRAPFGNTQGYQQTLPQQYGQEVGQGMSNAGRSVIQRQLNVSPTITAKAGTEVTIALGQNVSLQTPPVVVQQ